MACTAVTNSPSLMNYFMKERIAGQLNRLAGAQSDVGTALQKQELSKGQSQYLQQGVQREGNVLQEEISNASEVVQSYATVMSSWRDMFNGLANAV